MRDEVNGQRSPVRLPAAVKLTIADKIRWHLEHSGIGAPKVSLAEMPYPTVSLSYWRPERRYAAVNFGDELSRTIVDLMLARRGATRHDSVPERRQMVAVGSVLHMAGEGATIWGTGLHGALPDREHRYTKLDVRAVRGPITQSFLTGRGIHVPDVFGDPGLLVRELTGTRFQVTREFEIGLVPNLHDMSFVREGGVTNGFSQIRIIDPMRSWNAVVEDILRHKFIVASSLHGLVIADAFGIPARYLRLTETEKLLKYEDYYEGTGRQLRYATTLAEAFDMGGEAPLAWDSSGLMGAFPYDLWSF